MIFRFIPFFGRIAKIVIFLAGIFAGILLAGYMASERCDAENGRWDFEKQLCFVVLKK